MSAPFIPAVKTALEQKSVAAKGEDAAPQSLT